LLWELQNALIRPDAGKTDGDRAEFSAARDSARAQMGPRERLENSSRWRKSDNAPLFGFEILVWA